MNETGKPAMPFSERMARAVMRLTWLILPLSFLYLNWGYTKEAIKLLCANIALRYVDVPASFRDELLAQDSAFLAWSIYHFLIAIAFVWTLRRVAKAIMPFVLEEDRKFLRRKWQRGRELKWMRRDRERLAELRECHENEIRLRETINDSLAIAKVLKSDLETSLNDKTKTSSRSERDNGTGDMFDGGKQPPSYQRQARKKQVRPKPNPEF